jgi:hypothetical protein
MPTAGVLTRTTSLTKRALAVSDLVAGLPPCGAAPEPSDAGREVALRIEVGRTALPADSDNLVRGSTLALDQSPGEPVEVYAGERLVARGEVVMREDRFFVRVTEVIRDHPAS